MSLTRTVLSYALTLLCVYGSVCAWGGGKFTPLPIIPTTTAIDFKLGMKNH